MQHLFDKLSPETVDEIRSKIKAGDDAEEKLTRLIGVEMYMRGYSDAVQTFSVWKDGQQTIGVMQLDPKAVIAEKRAELERML